jgi:hypothetical protein
MADAPSFAKLVPGFDFLQNLVKNAGSAMPNIGQWVAPTLDPAEIEKRIEELKTVQFWLEQNARMLAATIQALEVQRMTLSTLQTMNVQMADLRDSLTIRLPDSFAGGSDGTRTTQARPTAEPAARSAPRAAPDTAEPAPAPAPAIKAPKAAPAPAKAAAAPATKPVDPLQWWGALTKQFTELAASAMKESASDAAKGLGAVGRGMEPAAGARSPKAEAVAAATRGRTTAKRKPKRKPAPKPPQP